MGTAACVIASLIILLAFCLLFFVLLWKIAFNYGGQTKLNIRTFKNIYRINKSKWVFERNYMADDEIRHLRYRGRKVKLSFLAFLWLLFDIAISKRSNRRKTERDALIFILEDCQEDINALKNEADNEIKRAVQEQKKIISNWEYYM